MKTVAIMGVVLLAGSPSEIYAAEPMAFVCSFTEGVIADVQARWAAKPTTDVMNYTFAGLDPAMSSAQVIGNAGAATVHLIKGAHTWNFIEVTGVGNVMTTTVFKSADGRNHPAVHSRHTALSDGEPLPSQYRGMCEAKN
jgi:hypothetical protein